MKDNEIIKILECCSKAECWNCPYEPKQYKKGTFGCSGENMKDALDLIKRQKAEIERLQKLVAGKQTIIDELSALITDTCEDCKVKLEANKVKSEAIKEFADGLVTMFLNINESLNCEDIVENIKRFSSRLTEGRENG